MSERIITEDTPKWSFQFDVTTPDAGMFDPARPLAETPRYMTITILHYGVPVVVADGPLKVETYGEGFDAIRKMMEDANRADATHPQSA